VYTALGLSIAAVFVIDCYTPLGLAIWVLYLVPVVLSYLQWYPSVPIAAAAASTLLTLIGFFVSPAGTDPLFAQVNRAMGMATSWALALFGYQFIHNKLAVRKQEWLQSGQTFLSENLIGEQDLGRLGDNVLRCLVGYLGAQAGAIFIEEGTGFRRFATHGVAEAARMPERFEAGDGLLGQAIKDKQVCILHDLPDQYFTIGSGLGRSAPRHLLIAPLAIDDQVNTVLELGFFAPIGHADTELITRVSESIAVAVRSAKYRARLQDLLEETQRQAEELQVQSEELRVTNEELEEQSRALKESHVHLEQQQAELEQINSQLEEQAQLLENQKEDLHDANLALEAQAGQLERASRYKSEFLANMSHEMRTPLNSSLILAKLLADNPDGNLTSDQVKSLTTIEAAGNDLLALIDDVLDLAKVEAGRLDLSLRQVSIARLIENLRALFQPQAAKKGLRLAMRRSPETPEYLESDHQRLEQVLKNLLSNAIKFTEAGEVSLDVSRSPDGRVAFSVTDTGIGIPEEQRDVIFEPFCQADGTTNRRYGGTGLGLSISREFVRLLGGEIQLRSVVGKGSTFTLLLPETYIPAATPPRLSGGATEKAPTPAIAPGRSGTASEPAPSAVAGVDDDRDRLSADRRVILIVEDDEPFARILSDLAHEFKFQALIANTAADAVTLAARYVPSAVVLDLGLPDHSGLSVIDRLKVDPRTRHIPVHVVSAHDQMQTALSLGAVGCLLKPVRREQLIEAFQQFESRLTQKPRRVLIVEDDPTQRDSVRRLLNSPGVETIGVASAAECLQQLADKTFDCMVLDLTLPDATGFSLLETLRQADEYAFPPVIVYTGRDLSSEEEQRLRKYSHSIIIKGAKSPERLLDEVTLFLHQVVSTLPPEQQAMLEKTRGRHAALEGRRILVVEDDVRNIFALSAILEPHGAAVDIARNGLECLALLERPLQDGERPVDLVLMDIMMPEMDGLTAMRAIRERAEWRNLPIIALTAKAMKQDQEQALAAGANDYMAKPLNVDQLLSLVRVWMPR
jgi:CheY-like chemotaxis protein